MGMFWETEQTDVNLELGGEVRAGRLDEGRSEAGKEGRVGSETGIEDPQDHEKVEVDEPLRVDCCSHPVIRTTGTIHDSRQRARRRQRTVLQPILVLTQRVCWTAEEELVKWPAGAYLRTGCLGPPLLSTLSVLGKGR